MGLSILPASVDPSVLPTPGSPMSTGLFLVLRERMRMVRRISFFALNLPTYPYRLYLVGVFI